MKYLTEVFLTQENVEENIWSKFLYAVSKLNGILKKIVILKSLKLVVIIQSLDLISKDFIVNTVIEPLLLPPLLLIFINKYLMILT